jgi:hypothetical protein
LEVVSIATFPKGHNAYLMRCENAEKIASAARETGGSLVVEKRLMMHTAADAISLRGIPAVGRGVAGVIFGTQPESAATR